MSVKSLKFPHCVACLKSTLNLLDCDEGSPGLLFTIVGDGLVAAQPTKADEVFGVLIIVEVLLDMVGTSPILMATMS